MTDKRLTALTEITNPAHDDYVYLVDSSDATDSAEGSSRKVQVKNLPQAAVNVRAYGAIGDGVTDDTQAIKDAIASLGIWTTTGSTESLSESGGGEVFFPTGDYLITDTLLYYTGMRFTGQGKGTILRFKPATAIGLFELGGDFKGTAGGFSCAWSNFTMIGDRKINDLTGNCTIGLNLADVVYAKVSNVHMNGWDIAINSSSVITNSSYFCSVFRCQFIYNRRQIIQGPDGAVFQITDSILTKHANTTATVDYQIECEKAIHMIGGALQGSTIGTAHVKDTGGRFHELGTYIDGSGDTLELSRNSGGGSSVVLANAAGTNSLVLKTMFDDPTSWWSDDYSRGFLIDNDGGNFADRIKNGDFRYGVENWQFTPAEGTLRYLGDRSELFMFDSGIEITKTSTSNHARMRQYIPVLPEAECYITVLAQKSSDALNTLTLDTGLGTHSFRELATFGDVDTDQPWKLYAAWIPYYKTSAITTTEISIRIGLLSSSPIGSWIRMTGVQMYTGGYPVLPARKNSYETSGTAPSVGHPQINERIYNEAPAAGSSQGWVCTKRTDTTLSSGASGAQAVIAVTNSTGWAIGDTVGVDLDNGQQHWSTIASLAPITLNENLPTAAASSNRVTQHLYTAMPNL